ncbi:MAG TPA: SDR family oxidoreductase [Thermoanaerobaculia bacterium]|nr:SDR family oxidoreductase [Thermoanaerobaculia bacterium]
MNLAGKVALVTGGARRLGRAIALELATSGASIALHYGRSTLEAEATAAEIRARGVEVWPLPADLARPEQIASLFAAVEARAGRLDVLVNSAACFEKKPLVEISAEEWDAVMAVNLRAPFLTTRHAASLMTASPRPEGAPGAIVNLVDLAALHPWPGYAHHGVAKAGLAHLTRVAARELAPGVRVNAVAPGAILPAPGVTADSAEWRRLGERLPLGRTGHPGEIARTVVFLAENDFITGAILPVDGGESLLGAGHRS